MSTNARDDQQALRDLALRLLHRDLSAVEREILAYPDDESLWRIVPGIANASGNLALHLAGNLRHFVGNVLGGSGYARDRDAEFSTRSGARDAVAREIRDAMAGTTRTLRGLDPARLGDDYPVVMGGSITLSTSTMLVHLATHTAYHLGQIDYHRRMITGDPATVGALPMPALVGPLPEPPEPAADAHA